MAKSKAPMNGAVTANTADSDGLPEGWDNPSVKEFLELKYGKGLKKSVRKNGSTLVYGSNGIVGQHDTALCTGPTIIVGRKGTVGAVNFSQQDCWPIDTTYYIDDPAGCDIRFLFYGLKMLGMESMDTSTAIPGLSRNDVYACRFPLPPLAEQKRIVAKVEALLERVNQARERLDRVPDLLRRFRQSVLAAACSGQLTADWREDDDGDDELPASWERRILSSLCGKFEYGSSKKSELEGDVPVLRMGNMQNGEVDWSKLKYTSDSAEIEKYSLQPNTVLFNRTNSPELVGKTVIYRGDRPATFAGYLIRIHHGEDLDPEYLNYCLNATEFREYCSLVKTDGVSQSNINAKKLAAYEMPWCELDEQQEIVRRVKCLFEIANRIEQRLSTGTNQTEKITQSILAKAFAGELVETEAALAHREARDYEPASVLLKRIATEHAAAGNGKPKKKNRKKAVRK